jgi:hypothetical protein
VTEEPKTKRERPSFCNNYRAMADHGTCLAGVSYSAFDGGQWANRPCFLHGGKSKPNDALCDKLALPSEAGIAAYRQRFEVRTQQMAAIGPTIQQFRDANKGRSNRGTFPCLACGAGTLTLSISGYNGRVHGHCSTEGCVSWMQ